MTNEKRPLDWLRVRVRPVLDLEEGHQLKVKLIRIAQRYSPTTAAGLAKEEAINRKFTGAEAEALEKATRWLAVIRRDYGQNEFYQTLRSCFSLIELLEFAPTGFEKSENTNPGAGEEDEKIGKSSAMS